jgi:two-component system LytT family response regulator
MIKAIVVDDEARSRQTMLNLLKENCPEVEVLALCDSVAMALQEIPKLHPDLVFLDVEMPHQNGFSLLEQLSEINFDVVFTTAHSHHAIKFSAIDYLLKPIDIEELKAAVDKIAAKKTHTKNPNVDFFLQHSKDPQQFDKIALPATDGFIFVHLNEIIRCEAAGSYTMFYFDNRESMLICKNLKEYEELLVDYNFFRIHHSHLVNIAAIQRYVRGDGGHVVMKDGSSIEVARRKKDLFMQKLMKTS